MFRGGRMGEEGKWQEGGWTGGGEDRKGGRSSGWGCVAGTHEPLA